MPFLTIIGSKGVPARIDCPTRCASTRPAALGVQRRLDAVVEGRPVVAAADVIVPGPHDLDRDLGGLCHLGGFPGEVGGGGGPAAEASAEEGGVDVHLLGLQPQRPARRPAGPWSGTGCPSRLQRSPSSLTVQLSGSIGAWARYGHLVVRLEARRRPGEARVDVALRRGDRAAVPARAAASARMLLGVHRRIRAEVPVDLEGASRPSLAAQALLATTATPLADLHHLLDAGHLQRAAGVERAELPAERPATARPPPCAARELHVDAEHAPCR